MVTMQCPSCRQGLRMPDEALGKEVRCKHCKSVFSVSVSLKAANDKPLAPARQRTELSPVPAEAENPKKHAVVFALGLAAGFLALAGASLAAVLAFVNSRSGSTTDPLARDSSPALVEARNPAASTMRTVEIRSP